MSVSYDSKLESEYATTAVDGPADANRRGQIRQHMTEYLTKMRRLEETSLPIGPESTTEQLDAFTNSLIIVRRWLAEQKFHNIVNSSRYHYEVNTNEIKNPNDIYPVLWIRDDSGEKVYHRFIGLSEQDLQSIFNSLIKHEYRESVSDEEFNQKLSYGEVREIGIKFHVKNFGKIVRGEDAPGFGGETIDIRNYTFHQGGFFAWFPTIPVDLSKYAIYNEINKENYKDNCFIKACIESKVLTDEEIDILRAYIRTKDVPARKVLEIAKFMKVNIIVRRMNEYTEDTRHRILNPPKKTNFDRTIDMLLFRNHYLINSYEFITPFYIEHYEEIQKKFPDMPIGKQQRLLNMKGQFTQSEKGYKISEILFDMVKFNRFKPIPAMDNLLLSTTEYDNTFGDYDSLEYAEEVCCKPVTDEKTEKEYSVVAYADFESDTSVNPHKAYLCCVVWREGNNVKRISFKGYQCGSRFLEWCPDNSLIYFHNMKYDASFFINESVGSYKVNMIEHSGKLMMLRFTNVKDGRTFFIHDSYSIISAPLKKFNEMFGLEIEKDICPYSVYRKDNIQKRFVPLQECLDALEDEDREQFIKNCQSKDVECLHVRGKNTTRVFYEGKVEDVSKYSVEIMKYAEYYCTKDCVVLMLGMEKFDTDLSEIFAKNNKQWIGTKSYISISAIGYDFAIKYGCLEGVYALAGKPQDFISRCVSGGRCMIADNKKVIVEGKIQDFDCSSLYPSAMYRMPGIPLGKPKVIQDVSKIWDYTDFYVEININKLQAKGVDHYRFPLVFKNGDVSKNYVDEPIKHFYLDKRSLQDLIEYYDIEYEVLRGYYFDEGYNNKINEFIKVLYDLRLSYKKSGNPLEKTIKLLLNSIYGKSILRPIKTDTKVVDPTKLDHFIMLHYNFIKEVHVMEGDKHKNAYAKLIRPINLHFNVPQFGVNVLSWSKHIMNEVMCLADQKGIEIYYQDTDSIHIKDEDVPKLAEYFKEKYGRELIGKYLGQFHCDFNEIEPGVPVYSTKLIAVGKKSYLDLLEDEKGNKKLHIRLKSIPTQVIQNHAKNENLTIEEIYKILYDGDPIKFNMLDGSNGFRKNKFFEMETPSEFYRIVHFPQNKE